MVATRAGGNPTAILTEFAGEIDYSQLPENVVELSKKVLLDTIGVMLAATTLEKDVLPLINIVKTAGGKAESSILGFGQKVPAMMAAFANGALSHALDYSSSDNRGVAPGGVTIPTALAMAEKIPGTTGKQLITAIAVGNEVLMRIGRAITKNPMHYGWVSPMLLGGFGAAVTAAKLAKLGSKQIMDAIGIALHQAGGTWEMAEGHESSFRAIRNSFVSKTGILAAQLAQEGISAAKDPLCGTHGLYNQYFRGEFNASALIDGLGKVYQFENISFKPYPSCRDTHTSIEAALRLVNAHDITPEQVEKILLTVGPMGEKVCLPKDHKCRPRNSIEAKFSLPFTVATAIVHRRVALIDFTDSGLNDPTVLDLAHRVNYQLNPGSAGLDPGIIDVYLKNGQILHSEVDTPPGSPQSPMSKNDLIEKFKDCMTYSQKTLTGSEVDAIIAMIGELEHQQDLSRLINYIS